MFSAQRLARTRRSRMLRWLSLVVLLLGATGLTPLGASARGPAPRAASAPPYEPQLVEVKFREGLSVRLRGGRLVELSGHALDSARSTLDALAAGTWARTQSTSEARLDALRARALQRAGRPMPDLNLYFRLRLAPGQDARSVVQALQQLSAVEAAYRVPAPPPLPLPPDYSQPPAPYQQYLDAAPDGVDARYAWSLPDGRAAGVTICDVEYSWNASHADLPNIALATPLDRPYDPNHGTAVLGILVAKNNGWGSTGMATQANLLFSGSLHLSGLNVADAITRCVDALQPGDVILLEQQSYGPHNLNFVPVEWEKPNYDAIQLAVAGGMVVVEAAGNGGENLDDPLYSSGNNGHYPFLPQNDSGALLVGAGISPRVQALARARSSFSTYGSTLDLQGWGDSVVTTGYGDLYNAEGNDYWYGLFAGTSAASPIVAGSAAILQGAYRQRYGKPATPAEIKRILQATGTPQAGVDHIGPLPNLRCALDSLLPLQILAPASQMAGANTQISAGVGTTSATRPITYTWQVDALPAVTHTAQMSDTFDFRSLAPGVQTLTVTATSGCGLPVAATQRIKILPQPVTGLRLEGPTTLIQGVGNRFSVTASPLSATLPLTYTWSASGQLPVSHTAGLSDTLVLIAPAIGPLMLSVTVSDQTGDSFTVQSQLNVRSGHVFFPLAQP